MGGNTGTRQQRRKPKVAIDRITQCRKSRAFGRDARGDGDSGAFSHDSEAGLSLPKYSVKYKIRAKKPNSIIAGGKVPASPSSENMALQDS
jgi:hypothetical protein